MNLRSDAFKVGPLIAFIAGMAIVAMFWASAIEMPIREVLKTAVGPGLGALIGASLAFHLNTTEKRRDERNRNIKALREAQFAIHFRYGMLSEYFQRNLAPYEQDPNRWMADLAVRTSFSGQGTNIAMPSSTRRLPVTHKKSSAVTRRATIYTLPHPMPITMRKNVGAFVGAFARPVLTCFRLKHF